MPRSLLEFERGHPWPRLDFRSEEQNGADRDVLLLRLVAVPGLRLGVDALGDEGEALGEAVVETEHAGLVLADQVARRNAGRGPRGRDDPELALIACELELR